MALNAYLKLKGQKSGDIKGDVTRKGQEGKIQVFSWRWDVQSPRDPASGLPTGKTQAGEFFVTKERDKSSPLLFNALATNENITEFELGLYELNQATGADILHQTWRLTNANIASMRQHGLAPTPSGAFDGEEMTFTFQRIELLHQANGASFSWDPFSNA
jgi:type VI secretion system secreted protein Hcp